MELLSSKGYNTWARNKARYLRMLRVEKPKVQYFHCIDDPYSHLVVQKLNALQAKYALPIDCYVVGPTEDVFQGDPAKFATWARQDAESVASYFGVEFSSQQQPSAADVSLANQILLSRIESEDFAAAAIEVGKALWSGTLRESEAEFSPGKAETIINRNNQMRKRLGHYLGGTFYYEGEWYWGLDRLHLLEVRLQEEGFGSGDLVCPLPKVDDFITTAGSDLVLEYFPSLRSPYTALSHWRTLDLIKRSGVKLELRPVMPMMMRGVPAPFAKQQYIISDSGREARYYGDKFGPFCDPFGEPVKRAFAAYHHAVAENKGLDFVTEYLAAAWTEGLDITVDRGLAEVCNRAGIEFHQVDFESDWFEVLEENLAVMAEGSLWGVPSFRVSGGGEPPFACWGQDRIWRVAAEIARRSEA